jgi:N-formylglutamate deformylase
MAAVINPLVLLTVPHAGVEVPAGIFALMLNGGVSEPELRRRLLNGADPLTDAIYNWPHLVAKVTTSVSRFVVDVNRSRHAGGPNGVIKVTDFDRLPFYAPDFDLSESDRENRLLNYWDGFHNQVSSILAATPISLLVDGHSMSATGPALGPDSGAMRPAICLATEVVDHNAVRPTCPRGMADAALEAAERGVARLFPQWPQANRVRLNHPFDGGEIMRLHTQTHPGIMIECNRGLYLDETRLLPLPGTVALLQELTWSIVEASWQWLKENGSVTSG